jgi:ABC-type Mn2+/Zn2+ transport system ATPase subunit
MSVLDIHDYDNNMINTILLDIKDVTYGYYSNTSVIEGIDLKIRRGEIVGLLGPNGSGKTTLLKIIVGLIKPWRGTIELYNRPIIGYMPQTEHIDWSFPITVEEVVATGIWDRSGTLPWFNKHTRDRVCKILTYLNLYHHAKKQIRELSGGELKKVFLARALIRDPTLLLLDEPTSEVDHHATQDILDILKELNHNKDITIILTTHDIRGVAEGLPRVICINKRILADGEPKDILTPANILKIYGFVDH